MLEEYDLERVAAVAERLQAYAGATPAAPARLNAALAAVPTRPSDAYRQLTSDLEALHRILVGERAGL